MERGAGIGLHPLARLLWDRQMIPARHARFLYRYLRSREGRGPPYEFCCEFFGLDYQGNLSNSIDFHIFYYGAFEKPILFFLRDLATALAGAGGDTVFLDVGANVGQHSLFLSRHVDVVHAFEPYPVARAQLCGNLDRNGIGNVVVHPVGLGAVEESLEFYAPPDHNLGLGSFIGGFNEGTTPLGRLTVVEGDRYLAGAGLDRVSMIKIDVEGFERPVLEGLAGTLDRHRPVVLVELSRDGPQAFRSAEDLLGRLPSGYELRTFWEKRKRNGRRSKWSDGRARRTGQYRLVEFRFQDVGGQADVIACPREKLPLLPSASGTVPAGTRRRA